VFARPDELPTATAAWLISNVGQNIMSYDFRLCLPQAGRSREEIATADEEELGVTEPVPAKEERKKRVLVALKAINPALEPFAFGFEEIAKVDRIPVEDAKKKYRHIELNGPEEEANGIQIMLFDDEASVTLPYWHQGAKARRVFEEIWTYLKIIESEGGFFTHDPQIGRVIDLKTDFEACLSHYDRVSSGAAKRITTTPQKRWWEFWK
jgi:hypothetical protein